MGYLRRSRKNPHTAASADIAQCLLRATVLRRATVHLRVTALLRPIVSLRAAALLRANALRRDTGHRPSQGNCSSQAKHPITALPIRCLRSGRQESPDWLTSHLTISLRTTRPPEAFPPHRSTFPLGPAGDQRLPLTLSASAVLPPITPPRLPTYACTLLHIPPRHSVTAKFHVKQNRPGHPSDVQADSPLQDQPNPVAFSRVEQVLLASRSPSQPRGRRPRPPTTGRR